MDESRPRERRIGTRWPVAGRLRWRPQPRSSRLSLLLHRRDWRTIVVEDLSITGARLIADAVPALHVGTIVELEAEGHTGTARVRWLEKLPDADMARIGVEFRELSPGLEDHIEALVAQGRPETVDWRWLIAR